MEEIRGLAGNYQVWDLGRESSGRAPGQPPAMGTKVDTGAAGVQWRLQLLPFMLPFLAPSPFGLSGSRILNEGVFGFVSAFLLKIATVGRC